MNLDRFSQPFSNEQNSNSSVVCSYCEQELYEGDAIFYLDIDSDVYCSKDCILDNYNCTKKYI